MPIESKQMKVGSRKPKKTKEHQERHQRQLMAKEINKKEEWEGFYNPCLCKSFRCSARSWISARPLQALEECYK